jgi:uncharacterized protein YdhG (YjbR/CyaY superfamily)
MKEFITVDEYIESLPEERKPYIEQLRQIVIENIPEGFEEVINYNMIGYVVPHKYYPAGYHCDPKLPLPFLNIASQKNYISFYHMGIYADEKLLEWFTGKYKEVCKYKLDMGKSCIRFKRMDDIPFDLIGELVSKITMGAWIKMYESVK